LTNPRSGANKKGGQAVRKILALRPDVLHHQASTPEGVLSALTDFAQNDIDLIIVNGGDGTVQAALTVLGSTEIFSRAPLLALLHAGTTSMLPRDVGIAGPPAAALSRTLDWAKSTNATLTVRSRSVLKVRREAHHPPLFGMFFGAGAICQGIRIFHGTDNPMGWRGQIMPLLTMMRLLLAILFKDHDKVPPFIARTSLDGRPGEKRADCFVLVSTLDRLFLGMRPYWGEESGPLRYTAIGAEPKYLLWVMTSLFGSRKSRHATAANGYFSHNVQEVELDMQGDFTLDGELYAAGEGPVSITSAGLALFLCSH
jgi:hypothetical protein